MTDMQAALGIHQLPRIEQYLARRNEIWQRYDTAFADLPITRPSPAELDTVHARHLYTILVEQERAGKTRDQVMHDLYKAGVGTGVHYTALHLHPYYRERFGYKEGDFPNAEKIGATTLSLPLSAKLKNDDVEKVIGELRKVFTT